MSKKSEIFHEYRAKPNSIVELIKKSKLTFYRNYFSTNSTNLRKVWKGIKGIINVKQKSNDIPSCLTDKEGNTVTNLKKIAGIFCDQYSSVAEEILKKRKYEGDGNFQKYLSERNPNSIVSFEPIKVEEICSIIQNINPRKAVGPSSIPCSILHHMSKELAIPLCGIANISFSKGIHPDKLKIAKVIPIFKKGSKLLPENYRPISLLSNINKIMEKITYSRVFKFLDKNKIFYKKQYGFRPKYSTNHALIDITEKIREALDKNKIAAGVFVDFQKAFDTVNHKILIKKLEHYGIRGTLNKWFESYLTNRKQHVSVLGFDSDNQAVNHGVPQGSVLGPLLFLIYINDLHKSVKHSSTFHFADDTNLLSIGDNPNTLQSKLNKDLKSLYKWLLANKISLNAAKTELIIFRKPLQKIPILNIKIHGKRISPVSSLKYLGIFLDCYLNGSAHCFQLVTKLQRANGMIAKTRHYIKDSPSQLLSLYHSIFSSHMIYGCQTWGLVENKYTKKIQTLQNRALRLVSFADNSENTVHTCDLYKNLKLLKFNDLVTLKNMLFIHDYFNKKLPESFSNYFQLSKDMHGHSTRNASICHIFIPQIESVKYGRKSFKLKAITAWNALCDKFQDQNFINLSKPKLKKIIIDHLLSKYTHVPAPEITQQQ